MKTAIMAIMFLVLVGCAAPSQQVQQEKPPGYVEALTQCEYEARLAAATMEHHNLKRSQAIRHLINECMRAKGF